MNFEITDKKDSMMIYCKRLAESRASMGDRSQRAMHAASILFCPLRALSRCEKVGYGFK